MTSKIPKLLAVLIVGGLTACHSGVKFDHGANATGTGGGAQTNPNGVAQVGVDPLNDPNSPLAKRSVYFDFDDYTIKPEYESLLKLHAQYLMSHPQRHVRIQGNTDERGTSEYNLALGQKRSEAVRRELVLFGVPNSQLEAISFGKEKPVATGHDEAAWAQNRRADLAYHQ
ncbi:peptidoglycan-associated lipoprotein Pal [Paraburkholderia sediminicola]|uniref:peptidoglycan-associated lipoprotein Pal n=1 Tax=Paraburkholderia sediminicola TaxID=458836 RepID=UPI0038BA82FD